LAQVDRNTFRVAEDYVVPDKDLWNSLEECLAEVDIDQIEDHAANFLMSYGADDWSDSGHHDYEYEIEQVCSAISKDLRRNFADWVRQIEIRAGAAFPVRCIDPTAFFLNFNYTPSLQRLYGVPDNRVLHIHGSAADVATDIILGHGWDRRASELHSRFANEATDVRVAGGYQLIDDLLAQTFKPTKDILARNTTFFEGLSTVTEVYVLGHSLAAVDGMYFNAVFKQIHPDAQWTVSYYKDENATRNAAEAIGIPGSRLHLKQLNAM
jgi:Bacteriophage abortive infection AbiH